MVLLEDLGALVGLVLAMAGITAAVVTDDGRWDGYGTIAIGILLGIIAIVLVIEMKSLLIGESATRKDVEAIRAAIEIEPDVHPGHPPPHRAPRPRRAAGRAPRSSSSTSSPWPRWPGPSTASSATSAPACPSARVIYIEPDVHQRAPRAGGFVAEHAAATSTPTTPPTSAITGHRPEARRRRRDLVLMHARSTWA